MDLMNFPANAVPKTRVKVLQIEDSPTDAELALRELSRDGLSLDSCRVETADALMAALDNFQPDVILSDFSLPGFDGLSALALAHAHSPQVPFMFVSGTIDEDTAIAALRGGACDYVSKTTIKRLVPAVRRAIDEVALREAREGAEFRFRNLIEFAPSAIIVLNPQGYIEIVNARTEKLFEYPRNELFGISCAMLISGEFDSQCAAFRSETNMTSSITFEAEGQRKDGSWFPAEVTLSPLQVQSVTWISCVIRNISKRREQQRKISRLNRIQTVLGNISAAGVRSSNQKKLLQEACEIAVNDGHFKLAWIGLLTPGTTKGTPVAFAGNDEDYMQHIKLDIDRNSAESERPASRAMRTQQAVICNDIEHDQSMAPLRPHAAKARYGSVVALPLVVEDVALGVMALYAQDIGFFNDEEMVLLNRLAADISYALEHQKSLRRLRYLAYFDSLTELPNRALFIERLQKKLARQDPLMPHQISIVKVDIDRFRNINDTLGRIGGNSILQQFAERLARCENDGESLARIDSNCFAFLVCSVATDNGTVADLTEKIAQQLAVPIRVDDKEVWISPRIGIATFPQHGDQAEILMRNAEAALFHAKRSKVLQVTYDLAMGAHAGEKMLLENRLRRAIELQQFVLHYQPKIDLASGRLSGLEALIRWNDPERGMVAPFNFIPALEETGLIVDVGKWVIDEALRQYRQWQASGLTPPRIAVNVSQLQIGQPGFVSSVLEAIGNDAGDALEVEITESLFIDDLAENSIKLEALRDAGITIAIDDFGTGYSSLSYISKLPIDVLKIDRSFIIEMSKNANEMAIVSTIIALAHGLQLKVVAEGVETMEQMNLLKLLRCDQIQGYIFSKPISADAVEIMLRTPMTSSAKSPR